MYSLIIEHMYKLNHSYNCHEYLITAKIQTKKWQTGRKIKFKRKGKFFEINQ